MLSLGDGVQIVETGDLRHAFAPHRHDEYVIGITTQGVQSFRYRREDRAALPGQAFVIHPDELHDGRPGTESGYGYRAAYISPELIGEALGGVSLPFVRQVVGSDRGLFAAISGLLEAGSETEREPAAALARLADVLARMSGMPPRRAPEHRTALLRIRDHLADCWRDGISMAEIEAEHGLDRFTVARHFRRYFGVSPHRFLTLRRLDRARHMIRNGAELADVAAAAGFADQSHMTRLFKKAFGVTPGQWRTLMS
ncbi:AraC family transcriptional regulator [Nisaea acidiphila]|uniref:AraC family transcriptional regulator n=1 Tax=Nisaea acidiphila TaxID=1862145 RepID=A0A9J7AWR1_9PROT|nr:AraC family transcriptional regulator [Nisaea acidiphila]UUX51234.1 AraC family transcriptional regulator [Nisaea acidiphila]